MKLLTATMAMLLVASCLASCKHSYGNISSVIVFVCGRHFGCTNPMSVNGTSLEVHRFPHAPSAGSQSISQVAKIEPMEPMSYHGGQNGAKMEPNVHLFGSIN